MFLKKLFCTLFWAFQIHHIFRYINRSKIVILAYHGVVKHKSASKLWGQLDYKLFKEHLNYLRLFYNVISIDCLADYLRGKCDIPDNSVVITFDDGYQNNYDVAYPLLSRFNLPATFFIATNFINSGELLWFDQIAVILQSYRGRLNIPLLNLDTEFTEKNRADKIDMLIQKCKNLDPLKRQDILDNLKNIQDNDFLKNCALKDTLRPMTWDQVKKLNKFHLITIGAHTADHQILTKCTLQEAEYQISHSNKTLERNLAKPVRYFAYPNGKKSDFNNSTKDLLKNADYDLAFTTIRKPIDRNIDLYEISRLCLGNDLTSFKPFFCLDISGSILYFRQIFKDFKKKIFTKEL